MSFIQKSPWMKLRSLRPDDKSELIELFSLIFPIKYADSWYENVTSSKEIITLSVLKDQKIIGVIILRIKKNSECKNSYLLETSFPDYTPIAYILIIGVHPEFQNHGIGTLLFQLSINFISGRPIAFTDDELLVKSSISIDEYHQQNPDLNFIYKPYLVYPTLYLDDRDIFDFMKGLHYPCEFRFCQAIYLHTLHSNSQAIKFYQNQNFIFHSIVEKLYYIDKNFEDAHIYIKFINYGKPYQSLTNRVYNYVFGNSIIRSASDALQYISQPLFCNLKPSQTQIQKNNQNFYYNQDNEIGQSEEDSSSSYGENDSDSEDYKSESSSDSNSSQYLTAPPPMLNSIQCNMEQHDQYTQPQEENSKVLGELQRLGLDQPCSREQSYVLPHQQQYYHSQQVPSFPNFALSQLDSDINDSDPEANLQMIMRNEYIHTDVSDSSEDDVQCEDEEDDDDEY